MMNPLAILALLFAAPLSPAQTPEPCMDAETRERVRDIMFDGIDQALKNHVVQVFDIWMKDDSDQPKRAAVGMRNAVNAYVQSRAAAERWSPPPCKPEGTPP